MSRLLLIVRLEEVAKVGTPWKCISLEMKKEYLKKRVKITNQKIPAVLTVQVYRDARTVQDQQLITQIRQI